MADPVQARAFGVQFREAIDYLQGKLPGVSLAWDDLAGPVHAKVFTIAGATSVDLVRDMQAAVTQAITNGSTITAFRKDFDRLAQQYGWTYNGKRGWRSGVIFNTNMRSAHMAGRWKQLQANKAKRPFLQYRTAGDSRVRPQHRAWNGRIYHIDDVFWQTHYPPNGWGCRCTVRAYGEREMADKELAVSAPLEPKSRTVVSRDGEIKDTVPVGIDPGWDHNVGQAWISPELALGRKLARLPDYLRGPLVDKTITPEFQTVLNANFNAFRSGIKAKVEKAGSLTKTGEAGGTQIVGFLDSATLDAMAKKLPDVALDTTAVGVINRKLDHLAGRAKAATDQPWPDDWIAELPYHLRNYRAVLWDNFPKNHVLIVVPQASFNETIPKITLRPNIKGRLDGDKSRVVSVVSLGSASLDNLLNTKVRVDGKLVNRYTVLVGKLGEGE